MESQLENWQATIDILKSKASKGEASVKVDYYETIEDLEKKHSETRKKLQQLRTAFKRRHRIILVRLR